MKLWEDLHNSDETRKGRDLVLGCNSLSIEDKSISINAQEDKGIKIDKNKSG